VDFVFIWRIVVVTSDAQRGSFCFAQQTDEGLCHISMSGADQHFNVQISMEQVNRMVENLLRVLEADRKRLFEMTVKQADCIQTFDCNNGDHADCCLAK